MDKRSRPNSRLKTSITHQYQAVELARPAKTAFPHGLLDFCNAANRNSGRAEAERGRRGHRPRRFRSGAQVPQRSMIVTEVRCVQDLNASIVLAIERRHSVWAAGVLGVCRRVKPKPQMVGLHRGSRPILSASGNGGSLKTCGAGATPGATMNVSMLKRPLKCWTASPSSSDCISP